MKPRIFAVALALGLCGCAYFRGPDDGLKATSSVRPKPAVAAPGLTTPERLATAVDFLRQGQHEHARVELEATLAEEPGNGLARTLLVQIDQDPRALLGEKHYDYKVKPGDTLSELAFRFLGDPGMFYALARYNNIYAPDQTEAGQVIMIPGTPKSPISAKMRGRAKAAPRRREAALRPASSPLRHDLELRAR